MKVEIEFKCVTHMCVITSLPPHEEKSQPTNGEKLRHHKDGAV